jgi:hypothetical protein
MASRQSSSSYHANERNLMRSSRLELPRAAAFATTFFPEKIEGAVLRRLQRSALPPCVAVESASWEPATDSPAPFDCSPR